MLVFTRAGSHTNFSMLSAALSESISTPYQVPPTLYEMDALAGQSTFGVFFTKRVENVSSIKSGILSELSWYDFKCFRESSNNLLSLGGDTPRVCPQVCRQLHLATVSVPCELIASGYLHSTASSDHGVVLDGALHNHNRIVEGPVHLRNELLRATAHDDRARLCL